MSSRVLRYRSPEEITFAEYDQHREAFAPLMDTHWQRNQAWIQEEGEKLGFKWVIVCGKEIVGGGSNLKDFPDDDMLNDLGRAVDRVAFAYVLTPITSEPTLGDIPCR